MDERTDQSVKVAEKKSTPVSMKEDSVVIASNDVRSSSQLDSIMDLPLTLSVELGRSKILVADLIKLHKGSVVELNRLAGEALDVLVNGKVVAKGEVIVVNEKFGIRLVEVVSHTQRIQQLGEK